MPTIREQIQHWRSVFADTGIEDPRLNAELLVAHVLGVARGELVGCADEALPANSVAQLTELCRRRLGREPVDYIIGEREFYGRSFLVRPGVLVPRPETELIIELAKRELPADVEGWAVDVGCGSGVLAVTLAFEFPNLSVIAIDISLTPLKVTRENAEKYGVAPRVHVVRADGLSAIAEGVNLTLAVSNPPYVHPEDYADLEPEVREHEPPEALLGGPDGLVVAKRILADMAARLKPGAPVLMEHGMEQGKVLKAAAADSGLVDSQTIKDYADRDRILLARA